MSQTSEQALPKTTELGRCRRTLSFNPQKCSVDKCKRQGKYLRAAYYQKITMDQLRVATLNLSWEANNARPNGSPGEVSGTEFFDLARGLPPPRHSGRKFGNAYEKDVADLKQMEPKLDIILLQEFQVYEIDGMSSIDVLVDADHLSNYVVVARSLITNPAITPPTACLVLVHKDVLVDFIPPEDLSSKWNDTIGAFPAKARPVAIADVMLWDGNTDPALYRLISSHSAHGIRWENRKVTQDYLDRFKEVAPAGKEVPPNLVWGGDFNCDLSAADCMWGDKHIRKTPRDEMIPTTVYPWMPRADWVMGTTKSGKNPANVTVTPTASDHYIVAKTFSRAFIDGCL